MYVLNVIFSIIILGVMLFSFIKLNMLIKEDKIKSEQREKEDQEWFYRVFILREKPWEE